MNKDTDIYLENLKLKEDLLNLEKKLYIEREEYKEHYKQIKDYSNHISNNETINLKMILII